MKSQEIEIVKILDEIAQNEHAEFDAFREKFIWFCDNNGKVSIEIYRCLLKLKIELSDCRKGRVKVDVDKAIIKKVFKVVKSELQLIRCKMEHPELFDDGTTKAPKPAGIWTDNKIDLIELIYALKMSVDNGSVTIKALKACFEYIFKVKLGNIYDRFSEIDERKKENAGYLKRLDENLAKIVEEYRR